METELTRLMEEVLQYPNVKGVMFTDEKGLCVEAKGSCSPLSSGGIYRVAELATRLDPDGKRPSFIHMLGTNSNELLIQQRNNLTVTVMRATEPNPTA
ncbi:ragulator complex protein LAMTOR5 homolog [Neocloeon triangulifer]|uniref:ragulator complex protein LAMTOR5 homolog n=1 Tax=Neocloeon triangulifer TaxID=2078957 RepID=UPI00286F1838|nr:ragulator complex protein LAMTOR5 homolog [Neocloeon triangulifer]